MKTFVTLKGSAAPLALGIALAATPAFAQDASQTTPQTAEDTAAAPTGEAIVVTGSRILSPNQTSVSPVTTLSTDDIKLSGTTRTEDLLNSLPQVVSGQSSQLSNGATGTATVDLRGLGPSRTLVLINGRRLMTGDPNTTTSAADLNFIPAALVKRVDVLTGGASATYGADAVAGVVNFIMDDDFTGFRIDANYGLYTHSNHNKSVVPLLNARQAQGLNGYGYPTGQSADGGQYDVTAAFGADIADGNGHFMAYAGYRKARAVKQDARDFSTCTIQNTGTATATGANTALQCGGSATSANGNFLYFNTTTTSSTGATLLPGSLKLGAGNFTRYNFAPLNYFQRPDERYTAGAFADYEINEAIHPYMEFMFMDDRTLAQIAPSGNFGNTLTINCDNPLLSANQKSTICNPGGYINGFLGNFPLAVNAGYNPNQGAPPINFFDPRTGQTYNLAYFQPLRRNVEGGPRVSDLQHQAFRTVIGSKGDLGKAWSYDAYYQYGRTEYSQRYSNEQSVSRLTSALDAVLAPAGFSGPNFVTNAAGQKVVCRSALAGDANCVPYDIFGGTPSAASLSYVSGTGFLRGQTSEQVASATLNGSLGEYGFKSPWASDGVAIALGVEYRKEKLELFADQAFQTGDLTGQGAPTKDVAGNYDVRELFGEIEVPLIQDSFFDSLSLNAGYRRSHYKISNGNKYNTDTYKFGVDFAPIRDIRFRAGYNRAARVPNIQELFAPQIVALDGVTDPCVDRSPIKATDLGCLAQGLRIGQSVTGNPAGQYNGLIGGTPSLRPEKATTKTLGVVLAPRWVPSLTLSVDYFDIKVKNAIQSFGADAILAACVNDVNLFACSLVKRNPAGSLWLTPDGYVTDLSANIGSVKTRGLEFNGTYGTEFFNLGRLSFNVVGTLLDKFVTDNGLTEAYDCKGYYGATCGVPLPKWRHKARVSFTAPNGLGASVAWRHIGSAKNEFLNPSATLASNYFTFGSKLKSIDYIDLALTANIGDHFSWRLGAQNLFDKDPRLVSSGKSDGSFSQCAGTFCNGNTYPGLYDTLGRYVYTGITLDF